MITIGEGVPRYTPPRPAPDVLELHRRTQVATVTMPSGRLRKRCRTCRNCWDWGEAHVDGLYCSLACAGVPEELAARYTAWRDWRSNRCTCASGTTKRFKACYPTWAEALGDLARLMVDTGRSNFEVYSCPAGYIHVGSCIT